MYISFFRSPFKKAPMKLIYSISSLLIMAKVNNIRQVRGMVVLVKVSIYVTRNGLSFQVT